ncbi:HIRAN domain-containing protein [Pedobacter glucosidilyticus]|uniref:HIRAN domain-containing protein n=1 Tax=Pedobacter glucosidilyticus TaxID=1122941 RepID=UPI0026E99EC9|nr:HIRAN domain-containing protein [Pedobacter glucosidilyticus]
MDRNHFLKSLGLGAGGLILPNNNFINTKLVKIYDNYVRGLSHYDFRKAQKLIKDGDELKLLREPENIYDSFAIQVNSQEYRLGYIAAYENIILANMMDSGVNIKAYVSQKDLQRYPHESLAIEVFTELIIPNEKFIDNLLAQNRADDLADIYRLGEI